MSDAPILMQFPRARQLDGYTVRDGEVVDVSDFGMTPQRLASLEQYGFAKRVNTADHVVTRAELASRHNRELHPAAQVEVDTSDFRGDPGEPVDDLTDMTQVNLRSLAKSLRLAIRGDKRELRARIRAHRAEHGI